MDTALVGCTIVEASSELGTSCPADDTIVGIVAVCSAEDAGEPTDSVMLVVAVDARMLETSVKREDARTELVLMNDGIGAAVYKDEAGGI